MLPGSVSDPFSLGITSCIGCASCSYICPSRLDLAHSIIQAKAQLIPEQE